MSEITKGAADWWVREVARMITAEIPLTVDYTATDTGRIIHCVILFTDKIDAIDMEYRR